MSKLDATAAIISYEEYHPFGTTSYRSSRTETEVSLKRYKYVGKERDEETGLYYYGARYYAAWLCRFVSVDPLQFKYPHYTPYQYAGNKPISYIDLDGLEEYNEDKVPKGANPELYEKNGEQLESNNGTKLNGNPYLETSIMKKSNIEFKTEESLDLYNSKMSPAKYKKNFWGSTRMVDNGCDPGFQEVVKYIETHTEVEVIVQKVDYETISKIVNGKAWGTIVPGDDNPETGNKRIFVLYSDPSEKGAATLEGEKYGGDWTHVLLEELFHVKQALESEEWNKNKRLPIFSEDMEVDAKEFSASHGGKFEIYYENRDWNFPTELGIMSGRDDKNNSDREFKKNYLFRDVDITIWKKNKDSFINPIQDIQRHHAIYK